jgi:tetratricopeptide (TPR) repeat protein
MARTKRPNFDLAEAHKYFAAHCFNTAWDLIEKTDRTEADDRLMVALNQASIYHWLNRPDCTDRNLSIGYWQASRIQSLLGNHAEALRQAEACPQFSHDLAPFYLAYAHEALARAMAGLGRSEDAKRHLDIAAALAADVKDKHEREALLADLASVPSPG